MRKKDLEQYNNQDIVLQEAPSVEARNPVLATPALHHMDSGLAVIAATAVYILL